MESKLLAHYLFVFCVPNNIDAGYPVISLSLDSKNQTTVFHTKLRKYMVKEHRSQVHSKVQSSSDYDS